MLTIATLGPAGTNHELVAHRYMRELSIENYTVRLIADFEQATAFMLAGEVDAVLQCAVHPQTPQTLGRNFRRVFAVDSFIADSRELAVLTRSNIEHPQTLGILLPANQEYVDVSRWPQLRNVESLPIIGQMLLAGELDSGLTYTDFALEHPDKLRIDEVIGSPDDVWIVYTLKRANRDGGILAAPHSPGADQLRRVARA